MAPTSSTRFNPDNSWPPFVRPDVTTERTVRPQDFAASPLLVRLFLCPPCPYLDHLWPEVTRLPADYLPRGVAWVGISWNDAANDPGDSPANLARMVCARGIPFPILREASPATARAFPAVCRPEFYVDDAGRALPYHGCLDGSRPGHAVACPGADLRPALAGQPGAVPSHPTRGYNIQWN